MVLLVGRMKLWRSGQGLGDPNPFLEHDAVVSSVMASRVTKLPQIKIRGNVGEARSTNP